MSYENGILPRNELYEGLRNLNLLRDIIGSKFAGNDDIMEGKVRDAGKYGSSIVQIFTKNTHSYEWNPGRNRDRNILAANYLPEPDAQSIDLNVFRQATVTSENLITARAFLSETGLSQYNSEIRKSLNNAFEDFKYGTYRMAVGTLKASGSAQNITVGLTTLVGNATGEEKLRLSAGYIQKAMADLFDEMSCRSSKFNDFGIRSAFGKDEFDIIWNSYYANEIQKITEIQTFNKENVALGGKKMYKKFFGNVNDEAVTVTSDNVGKIISIKDKDLAAWTDSDNVEHPAIHVFAGDEIPVGYTAAAGESSTIDTNVIAKLVHKKDLLLYETFSIATNFYNPKSLETNEYLTAGFGELKHLKGYPLITLYAN